MDAGSPYRRPVTEADVVNWTRVIHALPNIHFAGSLNDQEEAVKSAEVRCLARMLHHTDKPFMFSAFSGEGMRWLWRLTEVVQSADRLPRLMVLSSVNSPLVYGWGQCEGAMTSAELGIPVCINSSAVAGATAPVTLAGNVVQMNAEILAALTILQLHRPGAPVVYAAHPMALDMKTGNPSISMGEVGLMSAACVEIGRFYGLPTSSNGICTDACTPDPLATLEKWANGYLPLMAGANVNGGAGSLACVSTVSLEQVVIDDDVYGHMFRQARGLQVDDETLAADVIAAVGPGNSYIMEEHTLAHFRDEYYFSPLANRLSAPTWEAAGARNALDQAADRVRNILAAPPKVFLSEEQSREVKAVLARRRNRWRPGSARVKQDRLSICPADHRRERGGRGENRKLCVLCGLSGESGESQVSQSAMVSAYVFVRATRSSTSTHSSGACALPPRGPSTTTGVGLCRLKMNPSQAKGAGP